MKIIVIQDVLESFVFKYQENIRNNNNNNSNTNNYSNFCNDNNNNNY